MNKKIPLSLNAKKYFGEFAYLNFPNIELTIKEIEKLSMKGIPCPNQ